MTALSGSSFWATGPFRSRHHQRILWIQTPGQSELWFHCGVIEESIIMRHTGLQPCQIRVVYADCSCVATDWVGLAVTDYRRAVSSRPARHVPKMFLTWVKHRQETVCLSFSSAAGPRNNQAHAPVCTRAPPSRHGRRQRPKHILSPSGTAPPAQKDSLNIAYRRRNCFRFLLATVANS